MRDRAASRALSQARFVLLQAPSNRHTDPQLAWSQQLAQCWQHARTAVSARREVRTCESKNGDGGR
eukprot:357753-Chlamydomonas_euryale.AAC.3